MNDYRGPWPAKIKLQKFSFACEQVIDSVMVNPRLPDNFDNLANERRPARQMAWWGVPFIRTVTCDDPEFVKHWGGPTRYDLRCLDGGAWDRSTSWGQFGDLAAAVAQARTGHATYDPDGAIQKALAAPVRMFEL